jgi:hypothetical protein
MPYAKQPGCEPIKCVQKCRPTNCEKSRKEDKCCSSKQDTKECEHLCGSCFQQYKCNCQCEDDGSKRAFKDLQLLCKENCNFRASTNVTIDWFGTALTEITVDGKVLDLTEIGNGDDEFTLVDVNNFNGDEGLACLIAKSLRIPKCLIEVLTTTVTTPGQIRTVITGLPLGTIVTAKNNNELMAPIMSSTDVNSATLYCTEQIEPFFGVNVDAVYSQILSSQTIPFNFENILNVQDLVTFINSELAEGTPRTFACGNCFYSTTPSSLTIGTTLMIRTKVVPNPVLRAAECFSRIFGCSFVALRDTLFPLPPIEEPTPQPSPQP